MPDKKERDFLANNMFDESYMKVLDLPGKATNTVETCIKEPRFFLSSLDGILIGGLTLSIPACKVLNKVLIYSTCFACIYIAFSPGIPADS